MGPGEMDLGKVSSNGLPNKNVPLGGCTYEVEIVLDNVPLERVQGQSPVPHAHDKRMVDERIPDWLDVLSREKVLDEVTPL